MFMATQLADGEQKQDMFLKGEREASPLGLVWGMVE